MRPTVHKLPATAVNYKIMKKNNSFREIQNYSLQIKEKTNVLKQIKCIESKMHDSTSKWEELY